MDPLLPLALRPPEPLEDAPALELLEPEVVELALLDPEVLELALFELDEPPVLDALLELDAVAPLIVLDEPVVPVALEPEPEVEPTGLPPLHAETSSATAIAA